MHLFKVSLTFTVTATASGRKALPQVTKVKRMLRRQLRAAGVSYPVLVGCAVERLEPVGPLAGRRI